MNYKSKREYMMGCIKNPKKFLGIKYNGTHEDEIIKVGVFMEYTSDKFIVKTKCKNCGREYKEHFVTWDELLHRGLTNKEIEKAKMEVVS